MSAPGTWTVPRWLRLAPLLVVLVGIAVRTTRPVDDTDTWFHLRAGEEIRGTFDLVGPDPWVSFTSREWIRHQWLPDAAGSLVEQWGGLAAVAWLVPVAFVATTAVTYAMLRRHASVVVATAVTVLAVLAVSVSISARPQSISFPLTVVVTAAWLQSADDGRARPWLVPLTWVWACCHGFWFVAPALGAVVTVGMVLERAPRAHVIRAAAVAAACLAAAAVTPVGPRLLLAPFQVDSITPYIEEWQPAPARLPTFVAAAVMVIATLLALAWRGGPRWTELLLLGASAYLCVAHGRTIALAAAVTAPLLARAAQRLLPLPREPVGRAEVLGVSAAAAAGLVVAAVLAPLVASRPGPSLPAGLDGELAAQAPGTVVCNDYAAGGWLLWRHRQLVPVIDGRTELYAVRDLEDYDDLLRAAPRWRDVADARGCDIALFPEDAPVVGAMRRDGWRESGTDGTWVLLRRPLATPA
ncbi:MAG: hypothetical protein ACRCYR_09825 [Phycicoccus sp.]